MDGLLTALVIAALVIGGLLIVMIQLTSRPKSTLDKDMYRKVWHAIQHGMDPKNPDSLQMGIVKADKLLDKAMRDSGVPGQTMGDRLKARRGRWSSEDAVWSAHKLRNQIAHETHVTMSKQTARAAMAGFERALKDLGAL